MEGERSRLFWKQGCCPYLRERGPDMGKGVPKAPGPTSQSTSPNPLVLCPSGTPLLPPLKWAPEPPWGPPGSAVAVPTVAPAHEGDKDTGTE